MNIKKLITYSFILLLTSCSKTKNENLNSNNNISTKNINKKESNEIKDSESSMDLNLIGKTTFEFKKIKIYECWGTTIDNKNGKDGFAISYVTDINDNCRKGKGKILLEKFIYRKKGKANFKVKDQILVKSNYPKFCYSNISLKLDNDTIEQDYLIKFEDNSKDSLETIYSIWKIDLQKMKFIETNVPKNFKCINPEFYED